MWFYTKMTFITKSKIQQNIIGGGKPFLPLRLVWVFFTWVCECCIFFFLVLSWWANCQLMRETERWPPLEAVTWVSFYSWSPYLSWNISEGSTLTLETEHNAISQHGGGESHLFQSNTLITSPCLPQPTHDLPSVHEPVPACRDQQSQFATQ